MITVDFETYYDKDYTLRTMTTAEYIHDSRFEVIGVAVDYAGKTQWSSGPHEKVARFLRSFPWEHETCVAHNAMFDGAILEWVFGIKPARYFCTMMAARPVVVPFTGAMSLASVASFYRLGAKQDTVLSMSGLRLDETSPALLHQYAQYCVNDVKLARGAAEKMMPLLPNSEQQLIDLTIKKFTRPTLRIDTAPLLERAKELEEHKARMLIALGNVDSSVLTSNPKFAALLREHGVEPPLKVSPTTGRKTHAFAKTDAEFVALRDHPVVGRFVEARLLFKSSIEATRIQRLLDVANCHDNKLAVPMLYSGAHTLRFSGLDKLNLQNLTRGSVLREAIVAPEGMSIVAADLSQIEARITATLAGQRDLVQAFANGDDVYSMFASRLYGREINKDDDPAERFVGKTAILSLGYQAGSAKFHESMQAFGVDMSLSEAQRVVATYRRTYPRIYRLWGTMEQAITTMATDDRMRYGPLEFGFNAALLPNGMRINYPNLRRRIGKWMYDTDGGKSWSELYGGKLTENMVQALARIVMTTAELRLARAGLLAALSVHDELVFVVKDEHVDVARKAIKLAMTAPVPWMCDLPVACEIKVGKNYGQCK